MQSGNFTSKMHCIELNTMEQSKRSHVDQLKQRPKNNGSKP